jgi:hypothetical protein
MLGENGNLVRPEVPYLHKIAHDRISLLGVAGPVVEDVAVRRITPQQVGTRERSEKQRMVLESVWQGNRRAITQITKC